MHLCSSNKKSGPLMKSSVVIKRKKRSSAAESKYPPTFRRNKKKGFTVDPIKKTFLLLFYTRPSISVRRRRALADGWMDGWMEASLTQKRNFPHRLHGGSRACHGLPGPAGSKPTLMRVPRRAGCWIAADRRSGDRYVWLPCGMTAGMTASLYQLS